MGRASFLAFLLWCFIPATALAEIRIGAASDPVDKPESGADVVSMRAEFDDSSGHLSVATTFASPLPEPVPSSDDHSFYVHVGNGSGFQKPSCGLDGNAPAIHVDLEAMTASYTLYPRTGQASPSKSAPATLSDDRKTVTVIIDDASMVGANLNCLDGASFWTLDVVDGVDAAWFDGFPRVPPGPAVSPSSRRGTAADPRDQMPTLNGPGAVDIRGASATYDPVAGYLEIVVSFFEPFDPYGGNSAWTYLNYSTGAVAAASSAGSGYGCYGDTAGDLTSSQYGTVKVDGYEGQLNDKRYFNSDFTEMTIRVASTALSNRDYQCVGISLLRTQYSSVSDPSSYYDPGCGCWMKTVPADGLDQPHLIFEGFVPPACRDNVENDGDRKLDLEDPGCRGLATGTSELDPAAVASKVSLKAKRKTCRLELGVAVTPTLKPRALFPLGKVELKIISASRTSRRYRFVRRLTAASARRYRTRSLKPGRYRITARYLGDTYRSSSARRTKSTRVPARCG